MAAGGRARYARYDRQKRKKTSHHALLNVACLFVFLPVMTPARRAGCDRLASADRELESAVIRKVRDIRG